MIKINHLKDIGYVLVILGMHGMTPETWAQDTGDDADSAAVTDSDSKLRLEQAKEEAELRADIAEAKKREAEAEVAEAKAGAGDVKTLDGTVTLGEGAGYFSEILAYESLNQGAKKIADNVYEAIGAGTRTIVLTDRMDIAELSARWNLVDQQLKIIERSFAEAELEFAIDECDTFSRAAFAAPSMVSASLGAIAEIAGYFRRDIEIKSFKTELSNKALLADVATALLAKNSSTTDLTIIMPSMSYGTGGRIVTALDALMVKRNELEIRRKTIKEKNKIIVAERKKLIASRDKLKKEKAALEKKKPVDAKAIAAKQAKIKKAEGAVSTIEKDCRVVYAQSAEKQIPATIKAYDGVVKALTTAPKAGEKAPLEQLSLIDALRTHDDGFYLYLSIVGQGGEVEITKSIWTGGRISYIGGSTSVFFLTDKDGNVSAAGTKSEYHKAWYGQRRGVEKMKSDLVQEKTTANN